MADREGDRVARWAFDSHVWAEKYPGGRFVCRLCKKVHTDAMVVDKNFPLCTENYAVKRFLKESGGKS